MVFILFNIHYNSISENGKSQNRCTLDTIEYPFNPGGKFSIKINRNDKENIGVKCYGR